MIPEFKIHQCDNCLRDFMEFDVFIDIVLCEVCRDKEPAIIDRDYWGRARI